MPTTTTASRSTTTAGLQFVLVVLVAGVVRRVEGVGVVVCELVAAACGAERVFAVVDLLAGGGGVLDDGF